MLSPVSPLSTSASAQQCADAALPYLFILPGLDGTGETFESVAQRLRPHYNVHVLRYPRHLELGYVELKRLLLRYIHHCLPPGAMCYLLGASFSGPLAIELAKEGENQRQHHFMGLVLVTTFARNPFPALKRLGRHIHAVPMEPSTRLINRMAAGVFRRRNAGAQSALAQVHPNVTRRRVQSVLQVDASTTLRDIRSPILYLQATQDKLIPARALRHIQEYAPHVQSKQLNCGHFLLQECPDSAAQLITDFTRRCSHGEGGASSFVPLHHTLLNR